MTCKPKTLGLALIAVFAVSAMAASAASAATFTASAGFGTTITATDTGKVQLKVTGQTITCTTAHFEGTAPAASFTEISAEAEFGQCSTSLGTTATVTGFGQHGEGNPCSFVLRGTGTADLVCPAGQEVTIDAASCVLHISGQKGEGGITYTNNGSHVDIRLAGAGIPANHTDGAFCPMTGSGAASSVEIVTPALDPITAKAASGTLSVD